MAQYNIVLLTYLLKTISAGNISLLILEQLSRPLSVGFRASVAQSVSLVLRVE